MSDSEIVGEFVGHRGTWRLRVERHRFDLYRQSTLAEDGDGRVALAFADVAGVDFISDGCPWNQFLCIFHYSFADTGITINLPQSKSSSKHNSSNKRRRKLIMFRPNECLNPEQQSQLYVQFRVAMDRSLVESLTTEAAAAAAAASVNKPVLIIINPISGRGNTLKLFEKRIKPLLLESRKHYRILVTDRPGHATDLIVNDSSLLAYAGVAAVGGDGLVQEIVNGFARRRDWLKVFELLPVCAVAAGTRNRFAAAAAATDSAAAVDNSALLLSTAFNLVKFSTCPAHLMLLQGSSVGCRLVCSRISYGLLNDIDTSKIWLRGTTRLPSASSLLKLSSPTVRSYRARLSFLPASAIGSSDDGSRRRREEGAVGARSLCRHLPTLLTEPLESEEWITESGEFFGIQITVQSLSSTKSDDAGSAQSNEADLSIIWIDGRASRLDLLQIIRSMSNGQLVDSPALKRVSAKAFRLEPLDGGRVTVDGEQIATESVQGEVLPALAKVFTEPPVIA